MKRIFLIGLAFCACATVAKAENGCVAPGPAVCVIGFSLMYFNYISLTVEGPGFTSNVATFGVSDSRNVNAPDVRAVLTKVESEATALKNGGVCSVVINNVE